MWLCMHLKVRVKIQNCAGALTMGVKLPLNYIIFYNIFGINIIDKKLGSAKKHNR